MAAGLRRRTVLTASALAALAAAGTAGCSPVLPWASPPHAAPDVGVLRDAIAAEHEIIGTYAAVLAAFPELSGAITPLRSQHEEHLTQLNGRLVVPSGALPSATASPVSRASHPAPRSWATAAQAVAALRSAERAQAAALVTRLASVPPSLAQLFASIGASEASHAAALQAAGLQAAGRR